MDYMLAFTLTVAIHWTGENQKPLVVSDVSEIYSSMDECQDHMTAAHGGAEALSAIQQYVLQQQQDDADYSGYTLSCTLLVRPEETGI